MKTAVCNLKSVSAYSQGKVLTEDKKKKELHPDYEKRCWKMRAHSTPDGYVFIPPMAFANSIKEAARYMSIQVPGKKSQTFTKNFEAGVLVTDPLILPLRFEDVKGEWQHVPSDGKRGGARRVWKCFPLIPEWSGQVTYYVMDDIITRDVFEQVLRASGQFIGIGRFRPRNCGFYGRFSVEGIKWEEM